MVNNVAKLTLFQEGRPVFSYWKIKTNPRGKWYPKCRQKIFFFEIQYIIHTVNAVLWWPGRTGSDSLMSTWLVRYWYKTQTRELNCCLIYFCSVLIWCEQLHFTDRSCVATFYYSILSDMLSKNYFLFWCNSKVCYLIIWKLCHTLSAFPVVILHWVDNFWN